MAPATEWQPYNHEAIVSVSITVATLPPTAVSDSSLVITPNAKQNLHILGVNFIALIGKYQNRIIGSGITSFISLTEGVYTLVRMAN